MKQLFLMAAAGVVLVAMPARVATADVAKLQGEWVGVSMVRDGGRIPTAPPGVALRLTISGDRYTLHFGELEIHGTYKLNSRATPPEVDSLATAGPNKGKTFAGIYRFEGDTLTVCFPAAGKPRPKEFTGPRGSMSVVAVLKRSNR